MSGDDWDALEKHIRKNFKMKKDAPSDDIDEFIENVLYNEGTYDSIKRAVEKYTQKIPKHKMEGKIDDYKLGQGLGVDLDTMEDNVKLSKKDREKVVKNIKDNVSAMYDDELRISYVDDADDIPGNSSYEVFMNALDKSKTVGDLRKLILNTEISRW